MPTHTPDAAAATAAAIATVTANTTIAAQIIGAHRPSATSPTRATSAAGTTGATQATEAEHEPGRTTSAASATHPTGQALATSSAIQSTQHPVNTRGTSGADRARTTGTTGATEPEQADHITAGTTTTAGHQHIQRRPTDTTSAAITEQPATGAAGATIAAVNTGATNTAIAEHARATADTTSATRDPSHPRRAGTTIAEQEPAITEIAEPPRPTQQRLIGSIEAIDAVTDQRPTEQVHKRLIHQVQKLLITSNKVLRQVVQRQIQILVIKRRHRQIELLKRINDEPTIGRTRIRPTRPQRRTRIRQPRPKNRIQHIKTIRRRHRRRPRPQPQKHRHNTRRTHHAPTAHSPTGRMNNFARHPTAHDDPLHKFY